MTTRSIVTALAMTLALVWCGAASAQQKKCLAGKTKCMSSKAAGLLKCEQLAETPGKTADPTCAPKVRDKFDGGDDLSKGCFEKLENKKDSDCITLDDTVAAETAVDACVTAIVGAIDPLQTDQKKCAVGKKKCAGKYLASLLKCQALAQTPGKDPSPNANGCVDKAKAKYNGSEPAKGCFAKLEAKQPNDCQNTGDSATVQGAAETCLANLVAVVTNTTSTTTTTTTTTSTTTTTCPSTPPTVRGALPATPGRFSFTTGIGVKGADDACAAAFKCSLTHACTLEELKSVAVQNGELMGLKDTTNATVTSFWAIDSSADPLQQCFDDASAAGKNWEYGTNHTGSRGEKVDLNGDGTLGGLDPMTGKPDMLHMTLSCNFSGNAWVACCQ